MGGILGAAAALGLVPSARADDALSAPAPEPSFLHILGVAMLIAAPVLVVLLWLSDVLRPGSMRRVAHARSVQGVHAGAWLLAWLGVLLGSMLSGLLAYPAVNALGKETLGAQAAIGIAAYAGGLAIALAIIAGFNRLEPRSGLNARLGDALAGLVALAIMYPIVTSTSVLSTAVARAFGEPPQPIAHETLRQIVDARATAASWIMALLASVAAPVLEEIAYRGFLQSGLRRLTGKPGLAVLLASVIFAVSHAGAVPPSGLVGLFVLGVGLGIVFERRGGLAAPIALHMGFNAINIVLAMSLADPAGPGTNPP